MLDNVALVLTSFDHFGNLALTTSGSSPIFRNIGDEPPVIRKKKEERNGETWS
jgi:hypothetical protein